MVLNILSQISCVYLIFLYNIHFVSALENYDRHKVYQVRPTTSSQLNYLSKLSLSEGFDVLTFTRQINQSSNILVEPDEQLKFERLLQSQDIQYHVAVNNVTSHLHVNGILHQDTYRKRAKGKRDLNGYQRISDINEYLESLAQKYPKIVKVEERGKSYEGRPIKTILISSNKKRKKQIIFIDAGIHAREWMAPASALHIIHLLVDNYEQLAHLLQEFDFLVLPVVNPDGYEYSHTKKRMWRKTRSKQANNCYGVDGNRNYGYRWSEFGASNDPCDSKYHGPKAFSEVETRIVRDIMLTYSEKISLYVSFHAYGSYLLHPWGFTDRVLPDNWEVIDAVAKAGVDEIKKVHNKVYTHGPTARVMYKASGGSADYALAVAKIPIPITVEVRNDGYGFDPPPRKIPAIAEESWTCVKGMTEFLIHHNRRPRSLRRKNAKDRLIGTSLFLILPLVDMFSTYFM